MTPIPLSRPDITDKDIDEVSRVLKTGMLVQGEEVLILEKTISKFLNINHCSAVSNGTSSLHLALLTLGIEAGDEVILPAFSFVATANVVELVGARCIFVDIDRRNFNIDEARIEKAITPKTKAIIPVHEFGLCANMPAIMTLAKKHDLMVIEDAACALGATFDSKYAGTFGHFGSFSFHPRKAITSGEGGLIVSSDSKLDFKIKTLRNHGIEPDSSPINVTEAGFNYRLTDFQAALVNSQFTRMENNIEYKSKLASIYLEEIRNPLVKLPVITPGARHTWQTFHLLLENEPQRNKLKEHLKINGIMSNYGAQCIPAMTYYLKKYNHNPAVEFPNAYEAFTAGLAIPLYAGLTEKQTKSISKTINKFANAVQ